MNLARAALTISGLTLLSRITGLIRENLTALAFGAGAATDAFMVAFRLPNMLRRLFAEGAFSQAFVPVLGHVRATQGDEEAKALIAQVATALFWTLIAVTILGIISAPLLVKLMAGGFEKYPATEALAIAMTQWMFPYVMLIALVSMASGVLNTWSEFRVPAFTPVLLNLSFIAAALLLAPQLEQSIWALVVGVMVGGCAQLALQIWALKRLALLPRLHYNPFQALRHPGVKLTLRKMGPPALAMSVAPISLVINTNIASHQATGSVSWLNFADRLMEFPTALLGVALGTVLLPSLAKAHSQKDLETYTNLLDWGLRLVALLAIPSAIGLAILAEPLIAMMYHYGQFNAQDVHQTAQALVGYSVGLLGLVSVKVLAPGYFGQQDTKTPMVIALIVLGFTQALNLWTVPKFAHAGLALSISLAALLNAGLLLAGLIVKGSFKPKRGWGLFSIKLLAANAWMAAVLVKFSEQFDWISMGHSPWLRVILVLAMTIVGIAIYFGTLALLGLRTAEFRQQPT